MPKPKTVSARERRALREAQARRRRILYGLAAVAALLVVGWLIWANRPQPVSPAEVVTPETLANPPDAEGSAWGPADAPVLIEEFSDFQCPFCGRFALETGPQLIEAYAGTGLVRFDYRHFAFIGPESQRAAEAAECAAEQGAFWPYHDIVFANQQGENRGAFRDEALLAFAEAAGLDPEAFQACLDSGRYRDVVLQESAEARQRGVTGTPTFFINGQKVEGAQPYEVFRRIIETELAEAQSP